MGFVTGRQTAGLQTRQRKDAPVQCLLRWHHPVLPAQDNLLPVTPNKAQFPLNREVSKNRCTNAQVIHSWYLHKITNNCKLPKFIPPGKSTLSPPRSPEQSHFPALHSPSWQIPQTSLSLLTQTLLRKLQTHSSTIFLTLPWFPRSLTKAHSCDVAENAFLKVYKRFLCTDCSPDPLFSPAVNLLKITNTNSENFSRRFLKEGQAYIKIPETGFHSSNN